MIAMSKYKIFKKGLLVILSLLSLSGLAGTPTLTHLQMMKFSGYSRLIFTLSEPVKYHVFALPNPYRLVVDLDGAQSRVNLKTVPQADEVIQSIRTGHPKDRIFRIVFDLSHGVHYKKFMATDSRSNELVVDLYSANNTIHPTTTATTTVVKKVITSAPKKSVSHFLALHVAQPRQSSAVMSVNPIVISVPQKPAMQLPLQASQRKIIVVIDAGHGGKDPGTIGVHGTKEKDIVLRIAQTLEQLVNEEPNLHAILTRSGDYFVTLRDRLRLARKDKGDVFVAIHADSYFNNQSTGASVYALSRHGATTEAARWLARRENYSELGGVDFRGLGDKSYVLRSVLIDLAQTATIADSVRLGGNILASLKRVTNLHYTRVEQAPFMVLKSPDIPSILIETGFLSNPVDEENLTDKQYRDQLAQALLKGIKRYLSTHPNMTV